MVAQRVGNTESLSPREALPSDGHLEFRIEEPLIGGVQSALTALKRNQQPTRIVLTDSTLHRHNAAVTIVSNVDSLLLLHILKPRRPDTIFVHGAVDRLTMKYIPSPDTKFELPKSPPPPFEAPYTTTPTDGRMVEDVHEWVRGLNQYLQKGLEDFGDRPGWNDERTSRGGESVLAIQCRPAMWGRSVVCNSYADGGVIATADAEETRKRAVQAAQEEMDPLKFEGIASNAMDPEPAKWLLKHGIRRIVVGHKPTGDCPAVLSPAYTGVEVVAVDTSYARRRDLPDSGGGERFGASRGRAVATVEIAGEGASRNRLETSGVLACGTRYYDRYSTLGGPDHGADDEDGGDPSLGRRLPGGWWVKAAAPPEYHLCRGSRRFVEYNLRAIEEVVDEMRL